MSNADKYDSEKLDLSIVPPALREAAARAMMYGAKKYARNNWKKGHSANQLYSALNRHMDAWLHREDNDRESGLSHLDHAAACLAMLLGQIELGVLIDNRDTVEQMMEYKKQYQEHIQKQKRFDERVGERLQRNGIVIDQETG